MLDIGWTEIVVVAVVTLVVLGPKELPRALKTFGAVMSKARAMAREFQSGVDEMIRESELDDLRKDLQQATRLDFDESPPKDKRIDPTSGETTQPALPAAAPDAESSVAEQAGTAAAEVPSGSQIAGTVETGTPKPDVPAAGEADGPAPGDVKQVPASGYSRATPAAAVSAAAVGTDTDEAPPFGANHFDRDYAGAAEAQAMDDFLPPEAEPEDAAPAGVRDATPEDGADTPTGAPARVAG
ncbi:Sec-independent protein translocase protein TatB [Marinibaculum pumilum]|uniref:Sec-independent protein translocase protein TatB n=1 Tax=Marinibaculum pumilum TaxID=1766165 RepID=A0ABV7KWG5_9PROT